LEVNLQKEEAVRSSQISLSQVKASSVDPTQLALSTKMLYRSNQVKGPVDPTLTTNEKQNAPGRVDIERTPLVIICTGDQENRKTLPYGDSANP